MAETTVATLKADVVVNTDKAKKNVRDFGVSLGRLRGDMRNLQTTEERQVRSLDNLERSYKAGIITTDQFRIAQARLEHQIKQSTDAMRRQARAPLMAAGRGMLRGAGIAGAIVGGAAAGVVGVAERTVRAADTADTVNATVSGLLAIQHAGELTGVSAETTAMALQRLARRAAEAARGTGVAVDTFRDLGITTRELETLRTDQLFYRIAESMKEVDGEGEQLRKTFTLMDSEGAKLVTTLRMNQDTLTSFNEDFEAAFNREAVENARTLSENMTELNKQWTIMSARIGNEVIPAAAGFIELINRGPAGVKPGGFGAAVRDAYKPADVLRLGGLGVLAGPISDYLSPRRPSTDRGSFQAHPALRPDETMSGKRQIQMLEEQREQTRLFQELVDSGRLESVDSL